MTVIGKINEGFISDFAKIASFFAEQRDATLQAKPFYTGIVVNSDLIELGGQKVRRMEGVEGIPVNLSNLVRTLYERGFKNLVIVDKNKKPLHGMSWSSNEPLPLEKLIELAKDRDARGVGIVPRGCEGNVVILDIDDRKEADKILSRKFGNWLDKFCGQPESFCGLTGPRCPKDGEKKYISCYRNVAGEWKCRHYDENMKLKHPEDPDFDLKDELRGMFIVLCLPEGFEVPNTVHSKTIEIMRNNYQVVYGVHPSDVPYEPVRWVNGQFVRVNPITEPVRCVKLSREDASKLIELFSDETEVKQEPEPEANVGIKGSRRLSDEQINELVNHALRYYRPGSRDTVLFSILSYLLTHNVSYNSARRFVERIVEVANDEEAKDRIYTVNWLYKRSTERPPGTPPHAWSKKTILANMANVIKEIDNVDDDTARSRAVEWLNTLRDIVGVGKRRRRRELKLCGEGCVKVGEAEYGKGVFDVLYNPVKTWWVFRDLRDGSEFRVYVGDITVERIQDRVLNTTVIIMRSGGVTVFDFSVGEVIKRFMNDVASAKNKVYLEVLLRTLIENSPIRNGYFASGFYIDGYVEGYMPYPALSWECEPKAFEGITKFIIENYPPANRAVALANVAFGIAKVFSPAFRLAGTRIYEDRVVLNIGDKWLGKSTLFKSIINLLGLNPRMVLLGGDDPVRTPMRIRNFLMRTNAPLFIDDIGPKGFEAFNNIILPATVDNVVIGAQASRYGYGIENEFVSLRSIMANTNLRPGAVASILSQYDNTAWTRRFIILNWAKERIRRGVRPYEGGSILGCLKELWEDERWRKDVSNKVENVVDATRLTMIGLKRFNFDVSLHLKAIDAVVTESETVEDVVEARRASEIQVITRMYEIVKQVNPYLVLKAMVENPNRFDIRLTGSRDDDLINEEINQWEELVKELGYDNPETLKYAPYTDTFNTLTDDQKALAYAWWLISERKMNRVIIFAGSPDGVYPGWDKKLFGAQLSRYEHDGRVRYGYSVSLVELLKHLFYTFKAESSGGKQ